MLSTLRNVAMLMALMTIALSGAVDTVGKILSAAQGALRGTQTGGDIRTFTAKGTKTIESNGRRAMPFDISRELPDKFVWKENGGIYGMVIRGFNGSKLITNNPQDLQPISRPGRQEPLIERDEDQLNVAHANFASVTLGMFAASFGGYPLQFLDAPAGNEGVAVGVRGEGIFGAVLLFDRSTYLPDRLRYKKEPGLAGGPMVLNEWVYSDYRNVNGRKVPFRFSWFRGMGLSQELRKLSEWNIREFRFNADIPARMFRP